MSRGINANIAGVHDYNTDTFALPDGDWKAMPVEEQNTAPTMSDIRYPILDMLSEDARDAHTRAQMYQEQVPSDEHTASDKTLRIVRTMEIFPKVLVHKTSGIHPHVPNHSCAMNNLNWSTLS